MVDGAKHFLDIAKHFSLGELVTEQPHPLTPDLSGLACADVAAALALLKRVDLEALVRLSKYTESIEQLAEAIHRTVANGSRIYIGGCGATGRLALSLETLNRQGAFTGLEKEQIIAFMAGGDAALIEDI